MKRWTWLLIWIAVLLVFSTGTVLAQSNTPAQEDPLWHVLTPIIAITTMVERLLEIFWGRWEEEKVWPNRAGVPDRKDKAYIFHKQQLSQWIGTAFAFLAIGLTDARFFRLLGLEVLFASSAVLFNAGVGGIFDNFTLGSLIDWVMTAAIIGWGGTELVHNIIEALIKGRNLWKETQQVRSGERQFNETTLFYDYILPRIEQAGIPAATFYQLLGQLRAANIPLDDFISAAVNGTLDQLFGSLEASAQGALVSRSLHNMLERDGVPREALIQLPHILAPLSPEVYARFIGDV